MQKPNWFSRILELGSKVRAPEAIQEPCLWRPGRDLVQTYGGAKSLQSPHAGAWVTPTQNADHLLTRSTSQMRCAAPRGAAPPPGAREGVGELLRCSCSSVHRAQVFRAPQGETGRGEGQERRVGVWRRPKKPSFTEFNTAHNLLRACLVPDTVLGSGDSGMARMQRRGKGRGSHRDNPHNTGDKCFRGKYKVLWELRAAGHSFFPCWKSLGNCKGRGCFGSVGWALRWGRGGKDTSCREEHVCRDRGEGENLDRA